MTRTKTEWSASPAAGMVLARLLELYARARRVDAELQARRMNDMASMIGKLDK
jgi:hypothetical protein